MRVKRQKRYRKAVRFLKASFGFREPFKVLCDGNFQHSVLHNIRKGSEDFDKLLSQALGGAAKAFTTRCINAELKKLGTSFSDTLNAARKLHLAKCDHEPAKGGSECLESLVESFNPEHFFVATQDGDLRQKLRVMPGCAVVYSKKTSLCVEPPSEFQQQFAKEEESKRESLKCREQRLLSHTSEDEELPKRSKSLMVRDRPTFKRKRAKGPNPLSCKKKKQVPEASNDGERSSRKKVRRRNRKKNSVKEDVIHKSPA
ncbi:rRNA-processing protein UTP23 homolog [Selaginella moellendorffii]|uniref:rRNA-processing protein UTP23 homolog n=1 Tax=Selaginella moellendorffii TaxID=88036 RepID=UPI000D1C8241|nr:rRNA-processing protein UTP23 homolog [Selaginella moellendorffii]XP_024543222.1 rRNA-processing protein UTP23 homolog [Selaginella moellendorffii]XP_024543223.1 rRNA-processing protein UTP23 homolog [Selaginella moellendorffii]|eukprot:XP_024543221.1 rRNA-processing protein UTP23 homolog [Selaginella moellendorffii]